MAKPDAVCSNVHCDREIPAKYRLCHPCGLAWSKDAGHTRHPYLEPCPSYQKLPLAHLQGFLCGECGFRSADHPGGGRVSPHRVETAA